MHFSDRGTMITVILIVLVGGVIFTLWWWRLADRWANSENKRFRKAGLRPGEEPKRVVIKGFDSKPAEGRGVESKGVEQTPAKPR